MRHPFEQSQQWRMGTRGPVTLRDFLDGAIVFGCVPALVLSIIFWFLAISFRQVGSLAMIMAWLITLLLAFVGVVLLICYAHAAATNVRMYSADPSSRDSEKLLMSTIWGIVLCVFLAIFIVLCFFTANALESKHIMLIVAELLLVGYQAWRALRRRNWSLWKR
jgi:hypothetical protein